MTVLQSLAFRAGMH